MCATRLILRFASSPTAGQEMLRAHPKLRPHLWLTLLRYAPLCPQSTSFSSSSALTMKAQLWLDRLDMLQRARSCTCMFGELGLEQEGSIL
jgi:hypothetical protein